MKPIAVALCAFALTACYAPKDYAEADAALIAARTEADRQAVAIQAEATRQSVIAAGQAQLELDRAQELQRQTLAEQSRQQEAAHAAAMADIAAQSAARLADVEANSAQRLADIHAQEAEAITRGQTAWVKPATEAFIVSVGALGLAVVAIIAAQTGRRMGSAWALKVERQADIPLLIHRDPRTLTTPIAFALVSGRLTLVNSDTGEVLPLDAPRGAEAARLRYLAAQNIVALQAGKEHAPMLPALDEGGP